MSHGNFRSKKTVSTEHQIEQQQQQNNILPYLTIFNTVHNVYTHIMHRLNHPLLTLRLYNSSMEHLLETFFLSSICKDFPLK